MRASHGRATALGNQSWYLQGYQCLAEDARTKALRVPLPNSLHAE